MRLFPSFEDPPDRRAIAFPEAELTHAELRAAALAVAGALDGVQRVAVWATTVPETVVGVVGALLAGVPVVPVNAKAGERELAHILSDADPGAVLSAPGVELPGPLAERRRIAVDLTARPGGDPGALPPEPDAEAPAFIAYTSGTTGPPKGAVLPRRAVASNLDAVAAAWEWTDADEVVHGLPLFHVHGLIVATLGSLRRGGSSRHLGRFSAEAAGQALLSEGATMLFAVPTMYHRVAAALEADPDLAAGFARARLLVSGSAALPGTEHARIERLTGQRIVERYGMTETLMIAGVRASGERRAAYVGLPFDGVELRTVDDDGAPVAARDDETVGEVQVRGPNLFLGYLNRPDATAEAMTDDGWFRTGDIATIAPDGYVRVVGRRGTDLIKSGGFKIGAGEIEGALLEHPAVAEVAVTGEPDPDLGERIVAWVVDAEGADPASDQALADHVARLLTPHKRPRVVHRMADLPRNDMGKVQKRRLEPPG